MQVDQIALESASERYKTATFDPAEKGFSRVDTRGGMFLVSLEDAKPFLDGYKLALEIGNVQAVDYRGYTLNIKWGVKWDTSGKQDYQEWRKSLRTKEFRQTERLVAGTWNRLEVAVTPAKPAEIGYIEVQLVTDTVAMTKPR